MPALNYNARFADLVTSGAKPHTIRAFRARLFRKGDTLMHYTGLRTTAAKKIRPDTLCVAAVNVVIDTSALTVDIAAGSHYYPGAARFLSPAEIERLAKADGFESVGEFFMYFKGAHGRFASGQLVEWVP